MSALRQLASAAALTIYDAICAVGSNSDLDHLARTMWAGYGTQTISEDDAAFLQSCIDSRCAPSRDSKTGHLKQAVAGGVALLVME
jgi:hypothetical protein